MPEVTIKYKDSKTLEVLKSLSKYFDFIISSPKAKIKKKETTIVNGVTMIRESNAGINNAEMTEIFTRNEFDAKELRSKWQRGK